VAVEKAKKGESYEILAMKAELGENNMAEYNYPVVYAEKEYKKIYQNE
jgi:hypothetical protein